MKHAVVIPTLDPDERVVCSMLARLAETGEYAPIVVDDGSAPAFAPAYRRFEELGARVVHHGENLGKGAAIKSGMRVVREEFPQAMGVLILDGNTRYSMEDAFALCSVAQSSPEYIVVGQRNYRLQAASWRSGLGNWFGVRYYRALTGRTCPDAQTGLRYIPASRLDFALSVPGDRYEFEINLLVGATQARIPLVWLPIKSVPTEDKAFSHFSPLPDLLRIYGPFLRFAVSSLSCTALDLVMFAVLAALLPFGNALRVPLATVAARVVSATLNFNLNKRWSFGSKAPTASEVWRYVLIALCVMALSSLFVTLLAGLAVPLVAVKMVVDGCLFFVNYNAQHHWVFKDRGA